MTLRPAWLLVLFAAACSSAHTGGVALSPGSESPAAPELTPTPTPAPSPQPTPTPAPVAPNPLYWKVAVDAPVTATPTLWQVNYPKNDNDNDRLYAVERVGGAWLLRGYYHLYNLAGPDVCFDATLDGSVDHGALTTSFDGNVVYLTTTPGTVYAVANQTSCTGASVTPRWTYATGATVSHSAPWLDQGVSALLLYVVDELGRLHAIDAVSGQSAAGFPKQISAAPLHSMPIVDGGNLWVGDDAGSLLRVDKTSGAVLSSTSLCAGPTCTGSDAVYSTPAFDVDRSLLALVVNGRLVSLSSACTNAHCPFTEVALSATRAVAWAGAALDVTSGYVYAAFDNQLYKVAWPFTAAALPASSPTAGARAGDPTYPRSTPQVWNGNVFVGDGGGRMNRFAATATPSLDGPASTVSYGDSIDTTTWFDENAGNVYFGSGGGGGTSGALVQITGAF